MAKKRETSEFDFTNIADLHFSNDQRGIIKKLVERCQADESGPLPLGWEETVILVLSQLKRCLMNGCLPSVALAQAVWESGWFRKDVYYGIKARKSDVDAGRAIITKTREFFDQATIQRFRAAGRYIREAGAIDAKGMTEVEIEDYFFMDASAKAQFDRYFDLMKRVHPDRLRFLPEGIGVPSKASDPLGYLRYICRKGAAYSTAATYPEDLYNGLIVPHQLWLLDMRTPQDEE